MPRTDSNRWGAMTPTDEQQRELEEQVHQAILAAWDYGLKIIIDYKDRL